MKKSLLSYTLQAILAFGVIPATAVLSSSALANSAANQTAYNAVASQQGFELINVSVNKSPTDKAIYQGIRLKNGMEVLLISDEKANKSLMSVALPIGSMEDPEQQQGLAHYLEHMILMGSKAFPETNSLDGFLTKNGGYNNAYTASDRTVYYLEVNNNAFDEAVARLSDAFAAPLLSEKNAKKEVNAVNAEMVRAKSNDGFLIRDVGLATANPNHPITKLAVGNNVTLSDKENSKLQDELVKFYQQYYSANLMKTVLYSNQPIEKLAKLAESTLGKVENKNLSVPKIDVPLLRPEDNNLIVHYKPIKPRKLLAVSFDMPEDKASFKSKTGAYLGYVFNNNSAGTLSDYLIKQGLSDSGISAEFDPDVSRNRGDFSIYVALTDKGLAEKDKIISLIFQQIEEIKKAGVQQSYFKELKENLTQEFQHLQVEKGGSYISGLASTMLNYPLENIIDVGYIIEEMDEAAIKAKLALMNADNLRIFVIDPKAKTDKKTKYFEAPYAVESITAEQKQKWLDFSKNPEIKLPTLNPYFATDFSLNNSDNSQKIPKLVENEKGRVIYAMPSHYFPKEPKVAIALGIGISPEVIDLKQGMSATLLAYMADLSLSQLSFQASVAGMSFSPTLTTNGIGIGINGYTQHLEKLLVDLIQQFRNFELTQAKLDQGKQRYIETLDQLKKSSALSQANRPFSDLTSYPYFDEKSQRAMLEKISLADIEYIRKRVFNQGTGLKLLSVGNLSEQQIKNLVSTVEKEIKNHNQGFVENKYVDISKTKRKLSYITQVPHEDNAFHIAYFPYEYEEIDGVGRAMLTKDIISRWYFDDLRTDKQLGYVVYASYQRVGKTSGLHFSVQSPTASVQTILEHNQRYFKETLDKLKAMSDAEFEKYRNSRIELLEQKPESLTEEFDEFSLDFSRDNPKFDRNERVIERIKRLSKQDIIDFYQQTVIDQTGLVFASQALGSNGKINQAAKLDGFEKVTDIQKLQGEFKLIPY